MADISKTSTKSHPGTYVLILRFRPDERQVRIGALGGITFREGYSEHQIVVKYDDTL